METQRTQRTQRKIGTFFLGVLCILGVLCVPCPAHVVALESASLIDAAREGNAVELRAALQSGATATFTEPDGTTALHWASYNDDVESASLLIRAGAKVNAVTDLGVTPLWTATLNGSSAMVRRLLDAGANPNLALSSGETPMMTAARSGYADVVRQLIARHANVNARGARGQTALMWAVAQTHADVVQVLLAHGADVHARSEVWGQVMAVPPHGRLEYNRWIPHGGDTALMFAARVGDLESARLLVAAGANVNDADAWGVSATTMAAHAGFTTLVDFLLEKGADANRSEAGFSALHAAIMHRDEHMVNALLAHGADANAPVRTWTPMRRSSKDFHFGPELVGATPFWLAARFGGPHIMQLLVDHGADPLIVHRAEYFLESGAKRTEATTALMAATGMGGGTPWGDRSGKNEREAEALEAVKLALNLGVDVNAASADGRTALDAATAQKYDTVVAFLLEHGATRRKP